jgi:hypothetical protein
MVLAYTDKSKVYPISTYGNIYCYVWHINKFIRWFWGWILIFTWPSKIYGNDKCLGKIMGK